MANIRIDLNHVPLDGETVTFKAPCNASDITGLIVYYENDSGNTVSREFTLNDANGGDIGLVDNIFAEGAIVKVILDTDANNAFMQNPDTNTYLEGRFEELESKVENADAGVGIDSAFAEAITVTDNADAPNGLKLLGKNIVDGNLFDGELEFGMLDYDTGMPLEYDYAVRSANFIPVVGGATVTIVGSTHGVDSVYEYDKNKNYIIGMPTAGGRYVKLQDETRYIKFYYDGMGDPVDLDEKYVVVYAVNLFNGKLELGGIDWNTGEPYSEEWSVRGVDFIPVKGGSEIIVYNDKEYSNGVYQYDENYAYSPTQPAEVESVNVGIKVLLHANTKYIRIASDGEMGDENDLSVQYTVLYAEQSADDSFYAVDIKKYVNSAVSSQLSEVWTFTLVDGTTVEKEVVVR